MGRDVAPRTVLGAMQIRRGAVQVGFGRASRRGQVDYTKRIQECVLAVPEITQWPDLAKLFERAASTPRPDWEWPVFACQAVGGRVEQAIPGAAAIACMYIGIILVDDMLDEDPRGEHLRIGCGQAANMALAFQAAAIRVIEQADVSLARRNAVLSSLASLALGTAAGQYIDTQHLEGEESYWRIVRAKSTPFYGAALYVGAMLGAGDSEESDDTFASALEAANDLYKLGALFGEMIQIHDDLVDTFQIPASPDWTQGRLSLPILYARTADHEERERFLELLAQVNDTEALQEAQSILIRSGAVSYCAYQLVRRHRLARTLLQELSLADLEPMMNLWKAQLQPLIRLLSDDRHNLSGQVEVPVDLVELLS